MTDPALDDDKAQAAIANALIEVGGEDEGRWAYETLAALNEQGVVLCDEHALAELRQQAKAGEALIADLRRYAAGVGNDVIVRGVAAGLLDAHGLWVAR